MDNTRRQRSTWNWPLLLSVVCLNICLPSLVLSYGLFLLHSTELGVPIWQGLSTPAIFIFTYSLSQCWCRDAADSWGGPVGYRVMATLGLLLVVSSLLICVFVPYHVQPAVYGVMGGLGSSLISAQVDAVIFDTYDSHLGVIRGLCFAGQAIGQSLFPHILSFIIDYYEYSHSYMILAGIMLQTLPAIMFLRVEENIRRSGYFSRYSDKTYAIFKNEGMNGFTDELQLHDLNSKFWKSPSDDNLHHHDDIENGEVEDNENASVTITPPPSPEEKRRNIFGVEILPEIPEESEDEEEETKDNDKDTNRKRFSMAIKRLSTIGDSFDDYITKQTRYSGRQQGHDNKEYSEVEVTYDTISPVTDVEREKIFNSFSFRCQSAYSGMVRRLRMPSYRMYKLRRRLVYITYNINDTFIKPLTRSLSCWRFYPAVMLCLSKLILTAVSLVLLPLIASQVQPKISMTESNFLISLHGFTWMCFLLCTPWLAQTSKRNFKYVAVIGLCISTAASFVLAGTENHDLFSIGCVVAGIGYGAVTSCWETAVQDFVGARKWPKLHSTLETLSSTLLAVFVICISFLVDKENGLKACIFIVAVVLSLITFVWLIIGMVSIYTSKMRSLRLSKQ